MDQISSRVVSFDSICRVSHKFQIISPPEYTHPVPYTCPNGEVIRDEQSRLEKWGSCYASYYELSVEYYMSSGARYVLSSLTKNFLWMRALGSGGSGGGGGGGLTEEREEMQCRHAEGICAAADRINKFLPGNSTTLLDKPSALMSSKIGSSSGGGGGGSSWMMSSGERASSSPVPTITTTASTPSLGIKGNKDGPDEDGSGGGELGKPLRAVLDIATEALVENITQMTKRQLFTSS